MSESRIDIIVGHYGSGKTEVAINYALSIAEKKKVAIVDLDIVNPYFRSSEAKKILEEQGITVVTPVGDLIYTDIPALSPAILGMIENDDFHVIFDVGGDDMGARALGQFQRQLENKGYSMSLVVNPYRPYTKDKDSIYKMLTEIERASRLKVSSLIANPHLCGDTTVETVTKGYKIVEESSKSLNFPIKFVSIKESILTEIVVINFETEILPLKLFMLPPWFERGCINTEHKH